MVLAGGMAAKGDLAAYLTDRLGLELITGNPLSQTRGSKIGNFPAPALSCYGSALNAISPAPARLNFRREEFASGGAWKNLKKKLYLTAGLAILLLGVLIAGLHVKIELEKERAAALRRTIRMTVRKNLPDAPVPVPGEEVKLMEENVGQLRDELKYYRALVSTSAFDILREISRVIPDSIRIQIVDLIIAGDRVILRGRTNSYRSAELIKNSFRQSPYFDSDKIREAAEAKTLRIGGKLVTVEFKYTIPLAEEYRDKDDI